MTGKPGKNLIPFGEYRENRVANSSLFESFSKKIILM